MQNTCMPYNRIPCLRYMPYPGYSDDYDGVPLAAFHDVVMVTINYRLGPFGKTAAFWADNTHPTNPFL